MQTIIATGHFEKKFLDVQVIGQSRRRTGTSTILSVYFLNSLARDGKERVRFALRHFLGADDSDYTYKIHNEQEFRD